MKIAIDCRMIGSGGIGSYLLGLLPLFTQNNECLLFGNKEQLKDYSSNQNVKIIDCGIPTFSIKELLFFPKNISKQINTCDIFYSPYCNIPNGIIIPIVTTIHDVVFLDIPELAGKIGTIIRKFFYKYAIYKSKCIFTVSNFSKERIVYHLKPKKTPICVTYNALPHWLSEDVNKNIHKNNNILFVGNIKKHKGLHTLIAAFKLLLNDYPDIKLFIVGNSENFRTNDTSLLNDIQNLPSENIQFTGKISDKELKELYKTTTVLVQPSLYEGFGMPPLEALSLGTNVVLSDIPVFKEIYKDYPVSFFHCEDPNDLYLTLKNNWQDFSKPINSLPDIYSFNKTYDIIINQIKEILK